MVIGAVITGLLSCVCGIAGEVHHIGYTVLARSHWGMKGAYFVRVLRRKVGIELIVLVSPCVFECLRLSGGSVSKRTGVLKPLIWSVYSSLSPP